MHFTGIEVRGVARLPTRCLLTGDEIGVGHLFAAEVGFLEVALTGFPTATGKPSGFA